MATKKNRAQEQAAQPVAGNTPVSLRVPNDLLAALDEYRSDQDYPPERSAVIIRALRKFLAEEAGTES